MSDRSETDRTASGESISDSVSDGSVVGAVEAGFAPVVDVDPPASGAVSSVDDTRVAPVESVGTSVVAPLGRPSVDDGGSVSRPDASEQDSVAVGADVATTTNEDDTPVPEGDISVAGDPSPPAEDVEDPDPSDVSVTSSVGEPSGSAEAGAGHGRGAFAVKTDVDGAPSVNDDVERSTRPDGSDGPTAAPEPADFPAEQERAALAPSDGAAEASLAAEIASWTPPWQRAERSDSPPDEPVDDDEARRQRPEAAEPTARAPRPRAPEPEPLPLAEDLHGTLEAILLVCEEPVSEVVLAQTLGRPEAEITEALRTLAAQYTGDNRGFDLRRQAGGWRYYTREEFAPFVERFVLDGQQVRLTKAALETLSVVAYKQPVTRGRISAIRGVNCDGVIRTLTMRGLIEECGADPDSGAHLYRTTSLFLEKLGLNSLAELPPLAPFLPDDITQIGESSEN